MRFTHPAFLAGLALLASQSASPSAAQTPAGCIELTTVAHVETETVDAQGRKIVTLVPAAKVVPGQQVIYTTTARNVCGQPAERVVIDQPVPQHMTYVPDSARAEAAAVTFSLDGSTFAPAGELTKVRADGGTEPASQVEYRRVRFASTSALAPKAALTVRYRATVE